MGGKLEYTNIRLRNVENVRKSLLSCNGLAMAAGGSDGDDEHNYHYHDEHDVDDSACFQSVSIVSIDLRSVLSCH